MRFVLHLLFFLSGVAALSYQLVWSKMLSTGLGHEFPSVLAIICAFMTGMALGASIIDRFITRDHRAAVWLAALELAIGGWALLTGLLIPHLNEFMLRLIGPDPSALRHWTIAFAFPAIALLPATAAMGATLPAMEKLLSAITKSDSSIGSIYAANTFGAVAGTLLAPFVLMPALGLAGSCVALAAVNLTVSVAAFALRKIPTHLRERSSDAKAPRKKISSGHVATILFTTGLLGIGYETVGIRVLSQVLQNTVFTFAAVLSVFLLGTAAGAASYHRWWRKSDSRRFLAVLLCCLAIACLIGVFVLAQARSVHDFASQWGDSTMAALCAELLTATAVFAAPTFLMGVTFSHLVQLARGPAGRIGDALALNTAGAALAPLICGLALIPHLGCKWALIAIALAYLILNLTLRLTKLSLAALPALWLALSSDTQIIDVPPDSRVLSYREGVMATVAVLADAQGQRTLRVDNRFQMGGTAAADAEYRQAHIPLLLHRTPQRALFLGLGTGISFGAASLYPGLNAEGVELVPEIIEVMPYFQSQNFSSAQQSNLTLHTADARRFVRSVNESLDVIVGDVFHPYRDGAGALYTREHFAAIRNRLATNGLFCQWLPLHQLDEATLRVIIRTFLHEFPSAQAWMLRFNVDVPVIALIGAKGNQSWSTNWIESRLQESRLSNELKRLALADSLRLFGHLLADSERLRAFAGTGALNTDDNQRVTFSAPRLAYQRNPKPWESLLALMDAVESKTPNLPRSLFGDPPADERLLKYLAARNIYLRGLIADAESRHEQAIAAYIESARLSPEFTSGYAQCLSIVSVITGSEPTRAKAILQKLIEAQPERPVAREMLQRLFPP